LQTAGPRAAFFALTGLLRQPLLPQITHRDTINDIADLGAALIVKGRYYKPGDRIPEGERKLYLLLEGRPSGWLGSPAGVRYAHALCTLGGLLGCVVVHVLWALPLMRLAPCQCSSGVAACAV
jgi:hypothetical protein